MRSKLTVWTAFLCAALAATACRGGDDGGDDDDDMPDSGVDTDDVAIQTVQSDDFLGADPFAVRGVVVVAVDNYTKNKGNVFIAEPGGGEFSGVLLYGVPSGVAATLQPGDLVDIEGVIKKEFALNADTSGRTTTELEEASDGSITVDVVGTEDVPAPEVVDALAIGQLPTQDERDAEWEKWEGVLITVENVTITGDLYEIDPDEDPQFVEFRVTGPLRVDSSLSPILADPNPGDCLASVTGMGDYFFAHKILPRALEDIVAGGTACPAEEETVEACIENDIDDDADGFAGCDDFSCRGLAECTAEVTVVDVQNGTIEANSPVSLLNKVVTAVDATGGNQGFWIADAPQGAAYNGVLVYTGDTVPAGVVVGARVDVTGVVDEFDLPSGDPPTVQGNTLTEIDAQTGMVTVLVDTATPAPLTGVTANTLKALDTGEQYEGVLVQISNVKYTGTASGDRMTVTDNNGQTIVVDDEAFDYDDATFTVNTTCFQSITGVMTLNIFDDERRLAPVSAEALDATGGTCN